MEFRKVNVEFPSHTDGDGRRGIPVLEDPRTCSDLGSNLDSIYPGDTTQRKASLDFVETNT